MKKKSASQSAFFNLRVLIGLLMVLTGVLLALVGLGTFSGVTANSAQAQQTRKIINIKGLPPGFDCAKSHERGIDKMEGLKWGLLMLDCGEGHGGGPSPNSYFGAFNRAIQKALAPLTFGAADVNLVTG